MKPTTDTLKKQWWWRTTDFAGVYLHEFIWKDGCEHAAFRWELLRRYDKAPGGLPAFTELNPNQIGVVLEILGKSQAVWPMIASHHPKPEPGFSMPSMWRLDMDDHVLQKTFMDWINEQRKALGITPRRGRVSETSKPPSWRMVELLDLSRAKVRQKAIIAQGRDFDQRSYVEARRQAKLAWNDFTNRLPQVLPQFPAADFTGLLSK